MSRAISDTRLAISKNKPCLFFDLFMQRVFQAPTAMLFRSQLDFGKFLFVLSGPMSDPLALGALKFDQVIL